MLLAALVLRPGGLAAHVLRPRDRRGRERRRNPGDEVLQHQHRNHAAPDDDRLRADRHDHHGERELRLQRQRERFDVRDASSTARRSPRAARRGLCRARRGCPHVLGARDRRPGERRCEPGHRHLHCRPPESAVDTRLDGSATAVKKQAQKGKKVQLAVAIAAGELLKARPRGPSRPARARFPEGPEYERIWELHPEAEAREVRGRQEVRGRRRGQGDGDGGPDGRRWQQDDDEARDQAHLLGLGRQVEPERS